MKKSRRPLTKVKNPVPKVGSQNWVIWAAWADRITFEDIKSKTLISFFKDGFIVAGTSPKAWIFFPLIFPQFINFNENYIIQFLILIITYMVLDFLSLIGYAILAKKLLTWINANPRVLNTISACVLILIAIFIGFTQNY